MGKTVLEWLFIWRKERAGEGPFYDKGSFFMPVQEVISRMKCIQDIYELAVSMETRSIMQCRGVPMNGNNTWTVVPIKNIGYSRKSCAQMVDIVLIDDTLTA